MEGVGARLGRSSTRYGPATVFTGPVRKWKKRWVHVTSSSSNTTPSANHNNGNNGSHLLLYKWTPLSQSNGSNNNNNNGKDEAPAVTEEPAKRKFRYVPISVIEEQKREEAENVEDESKPNAESMMSDSSPAVNDRKPHINEVDMEENEEKSHTGRHDLNETSLDLSLGLKAHDGNKDQSEGGDAEMKPTSNSETDGRPKRKSIAPDLEMRVSVEIEENAAAGAAH
ncbi:hypothetical protein H6P81_007979 [Aristolochia fimbriata]|uniref:Uncharacterized protein n=1 Tax=Aristolochia fimbriata TaxID=158543 RepID=A0AAV7F1Q8_ARIFI|nr:hypothetical protein H6P81_007979 [Aristolochia fimbriata]